MYELLQAGLMVAVAIIGVIMAVSPRRVARKSLQESKGGLILARILGVVATVCAVFALVLLYLI